MPIEGRNLVVTIGADARAFEDAMWRLGASARASAFLGDLERRVKLIRAHQRAEIADKFAAMLCERFGVSMGFAHRRRGYVIPLLNFPIQAMNSPEAPWPDFVIGLDGPDQTAYVVHHKPRNAPSA